MVNPNKTPDIDIKEIREVVERTTNTFRRYVFKIGKHPIALIAKPSVYLSKGFGRDFGDSGFFAREIPKIVDDSLLEIGTGSGIVSIAVALKHQGIRIVATDINPRAVISAKLSLFENCAEKVIDIREGSMFDSIRQNEKFKFIFWNHPFHKGNEIETHIQMAGFDPMFQGFEEYAKDGHKFLKKEGKLLLGTGNFADLDEMRRIVRKNNCEMLLLKWIHKPIKNLKGGELNTFNIYEIVRR